MFSLYGSILLFSYGFVKYIIPQLSYGSTKSCGCLVKKHEQSHSKVYRIWDSMVRRCHTPTHAAFKDYGGRGITVCERWRDFINFYADMGDPPKGMSLDRKRNDEGYEPSNCRWATRKEQNRNTRANRMVAARGRTASVAEWSEELGWPHYVIASRLREGWSDVDAVTKPWRKHEKPRPPNL